MKYSVCLMVMMATFGASIVPTSVKAESLVSQVIYPGGYSSTTIYVPFGTTTTTTDRVIMNSYSYPDSSSFSTSTTTSNGGFYHTNRRRRQYQQPTVIFQQNNIYPGSSRSACTTSIIGSPIPSPIPFNQHTGAPCR